MAKVVVDVALQTNQQLFRVPNSTWETIPRERFSLTDDIWIGKLEPELARRVIEACEASVLGPAPAPVRQYAQLYSFVRDVGDSDDLNWDSDNRLHQVIALSRIVQPTTISLGYAARIIYREGEKIPEIFPGPTKGEGSVAWIAEEEGRDWLTIDDLTLLRTLVQLFDWERIPRRIRQTIWNYEYAAGQRYINQRWTTLFAALEALIFVETHYLRSRRQVVNGAVRLAREVNVELFAKEVERIIEIRNSLSHGGYFAEIKGDPLHLYRKMETLIRKTVIAAILRPDFASTFENEVELKRRLLPVERPGAIKAPAGTRDIVPPETAIWEQVEETARHVFHLYNFHEIRTPVFEMTELFVRGVGEETDIVGKEMFTWEDKARAQSEKSQSLTLRPENTAGVVRAYIEHKLGETGALQKLYYIGPQFRRERPQKGRFRQFWQIGAEVLGPTSAGSESPLRDAEVIIMLADLLDRLRITGYQLHLNSIGGPNDRAHYNEVLRKALAAVKDKMCADCQRRAETNPLRVLDCKVPDDQPIIETLPKISEHLDQPSREHFVAVQAILKANGIGFTINERMVRGLDYYQRTVFEFTHDALGAQSALLGGGRYDGLSEALGGPHAPGVGFALGLDRFVLVLQALHGEEQRDVSANIFIAPLGPGMNIEAAKLAHELRQKSLSVDIGDESFRLKKSFEAAERAGATYIVIVGENEVKANEFAVKNIKNGIQQAVKHEVLAEFFSPAIERRNG